MTWHHTPGAAKVPRVSVPKPSVPKAPKPAAQPKPAKPVAAKPASVKQPMPKGKTGVYDAKKAKFGTMKKGHF